MTEWIERAQNDKLNSKTSKSYHLKNIVALITAYQLGVKHLKYVVENRLASWFLCLWKSHLKFQFSMSDRQRQASSLNHYSVLPV